MMEAFPVVYLAAHGETAWTVTGQHDGLTDLPLTEHGEGDARALKRRLHGLAFAKVFTSPLQRDYRTCELTGFAEIAEIDSELLEWNYGSFEGRTEAEIRAEHPGWYLFRDGCPHGESPAEVAARAGRLISRLRAIADDVLLFSSAHVIRAIGLRWTGFSLATNARRFALDMASLSALGYEGSLSRPVIRLWNDTRHVVRASARRELAG
jgi:broad specificity phosphatase PhoE